MLRIYDFSVNHVKNPALVPLSGLYFDWKLDSSETDVLQASYRLVISGEKGQVFDSGEIISGKYFDISFPGLKLESRRDYTVSLTVTDNKGECASLSHSIHTGILPDEWEASWIKPSEHISGWAPYLRTKFETKSVKKAVMYACGLGCGEYYINGQAISDYLIDPPQSNYEKTVYYRRFDVTRFIREGGNALTVLLGEGFYSQSRVWGFNGFSYGDECVIIRLEITLADGSVQVVTTNEKDWKYKYSPITVNNIYAGETYDCRLETPDFAEFDGSDKGWQEVVVDEAPKGLLTPCLMPPVRVIRELPAVSVNRVSGKNAAAWIFDMGENIAGIAEFHLPRSPRGAVYVFRYAESLDPEGNLDMRSTGTFATQCLQQDIYIARGDISGETYRTRFTYHGYRYIEVTGMYDCSKGYGTDPQPTLAKAIQISTDMPDTGKFSTSFEDLDKFTKITHNTFVSNFHGLPEDCPAREKCGWLGDAQVVCNYGLLSFDSVSSYTKYLHDIRTTKEVFGMWQMIAPGKRGCGEATPLWGCAQIIIPYYMYKYTGNREAVLENFDLMEEWVQHELARSEDYIISVGLGDWCPPGGNNIPERIPVKHSSTAMFYEICIRMQELCAEFGIGNAGYYGELAGKIKESFNRHFYSFEKHSYGFQGTDGVALDTGLYPDGEHDALLQALLHMLKNDDYAMHTGIYCNKYLIPALCREGYTDIALRFLFNHEHKSFGTMLDGDATTIWECPEMEKVAPRENPVSSYNHPMHGGFMYFIFTHLCGITPAKPGFAEISFAPCFSAIAKDVMCELALACGKVRVSIKEENGGHLCRVYIPAGATFKIDLDGEITVNSTSYRKGDVLGSGQYEILVK